MKGDLLRPRYLMSFAALLVSLAAVWGCGSCRDRAQGAAPTSPAAFLPAKPDSAVLVPDAAKLGAVLQGLEKTRLAGLAASMAGARNTSELFRPVVAQLGFDPRTAEGFAQAGIDGKRGIAFGDDGKGGQVLILAVAHREAFDSYVAGLAKRFGAGDRREVDFDPGAGDAAGQKQPIVTFGTESGGVLIAYGVREGFAVIGSGPGAVEAVGLSLTRPSGQGLDQSPAFARVSKKLGSRDLYAWLPRGRGEGKRRQFEDGLALGIDASERGVDVRLLIPRGPLEVAIIKPLGKVAGEGLLGQLPADDFFAARLGGEPVSLQPLLGSILPRRLEAGLRKAGIQPVPDILLLLQPGVVAGLAVNPEIDLSGGLPTEARIARTNPFDFFHLVLAAQVKDEAKAAEVLEKLAANGAAFQMKIASEQRGDLKIYRASYGAGEGMSWALVGDTLLATGGEGRFEQALERLSKAKGGASALEPFTIADPAARAIFESAGSAAHLDVARLAAALRAIPSTAYGVGGFRLKELMESWVELLDEVNGLTASVSIDESGFVVDANLGLK